MIKQKFTKIYNLVNEAVDTYSNVEFKDNVVGNSTPSKDNINLSLLSDIQSAAKKANVLVSVTTAVSGHRRGSRHQTGDAVDIAMINGKGWSDENAAKTKGIYENIERFVNELKNLGYSVNVRESGNPKVVLWFGYKNHNNHVHVSNKSGTSSEQPPKTSTKTGKEDLPTPDEDLPTPDDEDLTTQGSEKTQDNYSSPGIDIFGGKLNPLMKGLKDTFGKFTNNDSVMKEEVDRIKNLMNL